ncbi:hypothetical protein [Hyphomonas sp.]|uniref:hypothetical protein n=1 Tax=Hyphomonas sp. TaxID=87 RepID=UPI0039E5B038
MLEAQYRGKEALRPVHDALVKYAASLGKDMEISTKKDQCRASPVQELRRDRSGDQNAD